MRTSQRGLSLIKSFEGLRLQAYQDSAGVWTIGYGTTRGVKSGMKISKEQAERMLLNDVQRFEPEVQRLVTAPLNQNQWDALMSLTLVRPILSRPRYAGCSMRATTQLLPSSSRAGTRPAGRSWPAWSAGGPLNGICSWRQLELARRGPGLVLVADRPGAGRRRAAVPGGGS